MSAKNKDAEAKASRGSGLLRLALVALGALAAAAALRAILATGPSANVLLITVDTLRADRIGAYGYGAGSTPHIDRLAAEGARFEDAVAHVPLTLPSHATLFTGTNPAWHGVRDNGAQFLSPDVTTLAEVARARGYRTGAFVSAFVLDSKWGLDRGFETYFDRFDLSSYERVSLGNVQRLAEVTVTELERWLDEAPSAEPPSPFFAWLHLYDPHTPYDAPEPFGSRYRERPYDGEVAYVDEQIGRLLDTLGERELLERTLLVFTSDHGEGLGEHDELTHGNFVYESTLRVPLVLRFPGRRYAGRVVSTPVGLVDLFPTLVEVLGAEPHPQSQGASLVGLLDGGDLPARSLFAESQYPRRHYGWSELLALRGPRFKLIDAPAPELYDLDEDPGETRNLAAARAGTVSEMKAALAALESSFPRSSAAADVPTDAETERRLRALGYLGSGGARTDASRDELPDPKDKIHLIRAIAEADALGEQGRLDEAIGVLTVVIAEDPRILDAYLSLGNKHFSAERYDEAIAAFRRCLEIDPSYSLALTNLALSYKEAGRFPEAVPGFERVLAIDPQNRQALFNLGEIHLLEKDYAAALDVFTRGLGAEDGSPVFLRQAGITEYYLGNLSAAEGKLDEALSRQPSLESAWFTLALIYEKQGRLDKAEEAYLAERESHPDHVRAGFNLARLYGAQERYDEQIEVLEDLTERSPDFALGYFQLAKAYRDTGRGDLVGQTLEAADRGLALDPDSTFAPLGHFLRAEMLDRLGRSEEARRAFERGQRLAKDGR